VQGGPSILAGAIILSILLYYQLYLLFTYRFFFQILTEGNTVYVFHIDLQSLVHELDRIIKSSDRVGVLLVQLSQLGLAE